MEALIRLCGCISKSSLDSYDIKVLLLLLFSFFFSFVLRCGSDYVVYTINERICRERERREMLFLFT